MTETNKMPFRSLTKFIDVIEEKNTLISDISHEFGTPLSRMQLAADIIENTVEAGKVPSGKVVKVLSRNIKDMMRILEDILTLSVVNTASNMNENSFNPSLFVKNSVEKFSSLIEEKNIKVVVREDSSLSLSGEKEEIEKVIENLLSNAVNYSPENGKIEIYLKGDEHNFSFTIKDEGPGIKEENKEKIFVPFFREDPSRNRKTGGTGLGLSIAKKIVSSCGGEIYVENPGEMGAIITFSI